MSLHDKILVSAAVVLVPFFLCGIATNAAAHNWGMVVFDFVSLVAWAALWVIK